MGQHFAHEGISGKGRGCQPPVTYQGYLIIAVTYPLDLPRAHGLGLFSILSSPRCPGLQQRICPKSTQVLALWKRAYSTSCNPIIQHPPLPTRGPRIFHVG